MERLNQVRGAAHTIVSMAFINKHGESIQSMADRISVAAKIAYFEAELMSPLAQRQLV